MARGVFHYHKLSSHHLAGHSDSLSLSLSLLIWNLFSLIYKLLNHFFYFLLSFFYLRSSRLKKVLLYLTFFYDLFPSTSLGSLFLFVSSLFTINPKANQKIHRDQDSTWTLNGHLLHTIHFAFEGKSLLCPYKVRPASGSFHSSFPRTVAACCKSSFPDI